MTQMTDEETKEEIPTRPDGGAQALGNHKQIREYNAYQQKKYGITEQRNPTEVRAFAKAIEKDNRYLSMWYNAEHQIAATTWFRAGEESKSLEGKSLSLMENGVITMTPTEYMEAYMEMNKHYRNPTQTAWRQVMFMQRYVATAVEYRKAYPHITALTHNNGSQSNIRYYAAVQPYHFTNYRNYIGSKTAGHKNDECVFLGYLGGDRTRANPCGPKALVWLSTSLMKDIATWGKIGTFKEHTKDLPLAEAEAEKAKENYDSIVAEWTDEQFLLEYARKEAIRRIDQAKRTNKWRQDSLDGIKTRLANTAEHANLSADDIKARWWPEVTE